MANPLKKIGFDRKVELPWINMAAELAGRRMNVAQIAHHLDNLLQDYITGKDARRKTRTVVLAMWAKTPPELSELRSEAFKLLRSLKPINHRAVHWGMAMAVYPFFGEVAAITGRLIHLQGSASEAEIQRRVKEIYGDRQTVTRAVQRTLATFLCWQVVQRPQPTVYVPVAPLTITGKKLTTWLIEAFLHYSESSHPLAAILHSPAYFPFRFKTITTADLRRCARLEVASHALDEELIMLRKTRCSKLRA